MVQGKERPQGWPHRRFDARRMELYEGVDNKRTWPINVINSMIGVGITTVCVSLCRLGQRLTGCRLVRMQAYFHPACKEVLPDFAPILRFVYLVLVE